jgi:hypothetical protein
MKEAGFAGRSTLELRVAQGAERGRQVLGMFRLGATSAIAALGDGRAPGANARHQFVLPLLGGGVCSSH